MTDTIHRQDEKQPKTRKQPHSLPEQQTNPTDFTEQAPLDFAIRQVRQNPGVSLSPRSVLHLQRMLGNQSVQRLLIQRQEEEDAIQTKPILQRQEEEEDLVQSKPLEKQNRPFTIAQQANPVGLHIQRWSIGSWFSKKGHELITAETVKYYNEHVAESKKEKVSTADLKQMKKGSRWNDLLGHWGIATMGLSLLSSKSLAHQSHEGELQFLHGMAAKKSEEAWQTQRKIMLWAEFCYKVATDEIKGNEKLKDIAISATIDFSGQGTSIGQLFAKWGNKTVSWLFTDTKDSPLVRMRAAGSMMHMLQDTFCASHTQRVAAKKQDETARKIRGFNVYTEQSAKIVGFGKYKNRHGIADKLKNGSVEDTAGAKEAVETGAQVLKFIKKSADWDAVVKPYLMDVFALVPELEQQKPEYHVGEERGSEEGGRRIVSASGRQFRKPWLSKEFKKKSSVVFGKRPIVLETVDICLGGYEDKLKAYELDTLTTKKDLDTRMIELMEEEIWAQKAVNYATKWRNANANSKKRGTQTRLNAVADLLQKLQEDLREIRMDKASIVEAQQEEG